MHVIVNGNPVAVSIVKNTLVSDKLYRRSDYVFVDGDSETFLLKNMLTGTVASLSTKERQIFDHSGQPCLSGSVLKELGLERLVEYGFLVEQQADDYEQYQQVISLIRMMKAEKPGTKTYTIVPTTGCNARCVYCYEEGIQVSVMTEETADRVADFICRTRWQDQIRLIWFGGEPLAGSRIISRICRRLQERNVPFRSKIITNATLMNAEVLEEAISLWHLESAQVSVDGERKDYEARKKYLNPKLHHYDAMMDAVGRMLERGIRVTLRCNYDTQNFEGLRRFADEVAGRFGPSDRLSLYPAMLFQAQAQDSGIELYQQIQRFHEYLRRLGLRKQGENTEKLRINLCGADNGDKSVVIAPDGRLYHCEHLPGNTAFGSVYDEDSVVFGDEKASLDADEMCRHCCFLPVCTPFFKNGCADYFANCRAFRKIDTENQLRRLSRENML